VGGVEAMCRGVVKETVLPLMEADLEHLAHRPVGSA